MIKILDVNSTTGQTIRFLYTPAGTQNIFGMTRQVPVVTVINRSIPTTCENLKDHGTLIFGDGPEYFLSSAPVINQVYQNTQLSKNTYRLVQSWIKHNLGR